MLVTGTVSFIRVVPGLRQVQIQLNNNFPIYQLGDGLTYEDSRRILLASWAGSVGILLDVADVPISTATPNLYSIRTVAGGVFTPEP